MLCKHSKLLLLGCVVPLLFLWYSLLDRIRFDFVRLYLARLLSLLISAEYCLALGFLDKQHMHILFGFYFYEF